MFCIGWIGAEVLEASEKSGGQGRSKKTILKRHLGFPGGSVVKKKKSAYHCRRGKRLRFDPWVRKISWSTRWQPIPVFLPGKFHGQRILVGYSPWGCKESDMTE